MPGEIYTPEQIDTFVERLLLSRHHHTSDVNDLFRKFPSGIYHGNVYQLDTTGLNPEVVQGSTAYTLVYNEYQDWYWESRDLE